MKHVISAAWTPPLLLLVAEEVDAISHSAVISACEKSSEWKKSLELLCCRWGMLGSVPRPIALLLACHGRLVNQSSSETETPKADPTIHMYPHHPNVSLDIPRYP